ncbi:hypothetical protein [Endozoicomonas sp. GU-1]|uniref:hypothetical protein n=1 Tax=Endozoicomonas sp. GU-1 TaxID=3009078 RepID=UPI0022B35FDE|nr:hypothetical protein [Endozoicomonas sp. GU-1]WBA79585.1 hypothetical protein O2T12_14470 [Endozoicomonas sp. GU-1]
MAALPRQKPLETAEIDREKVFKQLDEQSALRLRLLDEQEVISKKTSELVKQVNQLTEQHKALSDRFWRSIAVTDELNALLDKFIDD